MTQEISTQVLTLNDYHREACQHLAQEKDSGWNIFWGAFCDDQGSEGPVRCHTREYMNGSISHLKLFLYLLQREAQKIGACPKEWSLPSFDSFLSERIFFTKTVDEQVFYHELSMVPEDLPELPDKFRARILELGMWGVWHQVPSFLFATHWEDEEEEELTIFEPLLFMPTDAFLIPSVMMLRMFTDDELRNDSELISLIDPEHDRHLDPGSTVGVMEFQEPTPVRNWN